MYSPPKFIRAEMSYISKMCNILLSSFLTFASKESGLPIKLNLLKKKKNIIFNIKNIV